MPCLATMPVEQRFHKLVWGGLGPDNPQGLLVGGADRGNLSIYSAAMLLKGETEGARVFSQDK